MQTQLTYNSIPAFEKDLKRLSKKFPSLREDLEIVKKAAIELFHIYKLDSQAVFPIPEFCSDEYQVCKIKKIACRSLKGRGVQSGIRVIYYYNKKKKEITFLEIYFKAEQENEDKERIREFFKIVIF